MKEKELNYSAALKELEIIIDEVENSELNIDELLKKVKRAASLIELCKSKLSNAEAEIEDVLSKIK